MNLFSKDKELVLKLTNTVLLIWLIAALVFTFNSLLGTFMKEPVKTLSYEEYKETDCYFYKDDSIEEDFDKHCKIQFDRYMFELENRGFYDRRTLYVSLANVVFVGFALFLINKPKKIK